MDWMILPNESTDLIHHGVKGQKWGKRKQKNKVGKIPAKIDSQLSSSHKSLGKMKYEDVIKYYKSIHKTSPKILSAWLQKHKIGAKETGKTLNTAQYKKYVENAAKKAKASTDRSNELKNITNRALGEHARYKTDDIPTFKSNKSTTTKKKVTATSTKKKTTTSKKKPVVIKKVEEKKVVKAPFTLQTAVRRNKIKKNIMSRR